MKAQPRLPALNLGADVGLRTLGCGVDGAWGAGAGGQFLRAPGVGRGEAPPGPVAERRTPPPLPGAWSEAPSVAEVWVAPGCVDRLGGGLGGGTTRRHRSPRGG